MSERPIYAAWDLIGSGVLAAIKPHSAKVVLALAAHDNDRREVYPSREVLAKETGLNVRTIDTAVAELLACGVVKVVRQTGRNNQYTILPPPYQCSATTLVQCHVATCHSTTPVQSHSTTTSVVPLHTNTNTENTNTKNTNTGSGLTAAAPAGAPSSLAPKDAGKDRTGKDKRSPRAKRTGEDIAKILATDSSRLEYITGGSMQWWPAGGNPSAPVQLDTLTAPQVAGALWFYSASQRQANGLVGAESLPAAKLIGQVAAVLKTTPPATIWGWLIEVCQLWQQRRGPGLPDITPELILQPWWRDKLRTGGQQRQVSGSSPAPGRVAEINRIIADKAAHNPILAELAAKQNGGSHASR